LSCLIINLIVNIIDDCKNGGFIKISEKEDENSIKNMVDDLGGHIQVKLDKITGNTFILKIPINSLDGG